jgi:hypothetical protein
MAHYLIGAAQMERDEYTLAEQHFQKAYDLKFNSWELENDLKEAGRMKLDAARRLTLQANRLDGKDHTVLQAEDYARMKGVRLQVTTDADGGKHAGYIDTDDWLEYNVDVATAGKYAVTFRVASLKGGGQLQLRSGTKVLATLPIDATNGWDKWTSCTTQLQLPAGNYPLSLYAVNGGFTVNWMTFLPAQNDKQ